MFNDQICSMENINKSQIQLILNRWADVIR